MSNEIALPQQFKDAAREKILSMFMSLIPEDQLDAYIAKEVKDFFETETLLTVQETRVEIDNPSYDPKRNSGYGNERKIERACIAFGSKMTPFRQLVWTELHAFVKEAFNDKLKDETSELYRELDTVVGTCSTQVGETNRALVAMYSNNMATMMFRHTFLNAVQSAHDNMKNSMSAMGVDYSKLNTIPGAYTTTHPAIP